MKTTQFIVLLVSALLGFSVVACDDGSLPSDNTISPIPTPIPGDEEGGDDPGLEVGGSEIPPTNVSADMDAGSTEDVVDSEDIVEIEEDAE